MRWRGPQFTTRASLGGRLLPSWVKRGLPTTTESLLSNNLDCFRVPKISQQWTRNRRTCGGCPWAAQKARGAAHANWPD
jgi:hypothetical protein